MPALVLVIAEAFAKAAAAAVGAEVGKIAAGHIARWIDRQPEADRPALAIAAAGILGSAHRAIPGASSYGGVASGSAIPPAGQGP